VISESLLLFIPCSGGQWVEGSEKVFHVTSTHGLHWPQMSHTGMWATVFKIYVLVCGVTACFPISGSFLYENKNDFKS